MQHLELLIHLQVLGLLNKYISIGQQRVHRASSFEVWDSDQRSVSYGTIFISLAACEQMARELMPARRRLKLVLQQGMVQRLDLIWLCRFVAL